MNSHADGLGALVRRADPDRFFTSLFAPAAHREALWTLYAFNHETARAREVASMPVLALIRLQWWREVLDGQRKAHEVATPLSDALARGALQAADLLAIVDAREVETFAEVAAWRAWLAAGAGSVAVAAARALGMAEPEKARALGALYGGAGVLRSVAFVASGGRCLLPHDVLARFGLHPDDVVRDPVLARDAVAALSAMLRAEAPAPRRWPRGEIAAVLPGVFGRSDLRWGPSPRPSPLGRGRRLAVLAAYAASRA